jgi:hypothetical protein
MVRVVSFFPVDSLSQDRTVVEKNAVKMLDKEGFFDYASFWAAGGSIFLVILPLLLYSPILIHLLVAMLIFYEFFADSSL